MLSQTVVWTDIDAGQWANFWNHVFAPARLPRRVIGILENGEPLALVLSGNGAVDLDVWPAGENALELVAEELRRRLAVDQVILVERLVLTALWDEQQRFLDHEADYDDFVLGIRSLTDATLREHAVCLPRELSPRRFPHVPFDELRALVADTVGSDGAFLVTVFDNDELWWSLAGLLHEGKVIRLTSSQGLLPVGAGFDGAWPETHEQLVEACGETLGPVRLALGLQLTAFDALLRADDVGAALADTVRDGSATLSTR